MTKHYRQKLVAVIALSFIFFTSPLLLTPTQQIASRYNIAITVAPESPEHLAGIIV